MLTSSLTRKLLPSLFHKHVFYTDCVPCLGGALETKIITKELIVEL